MTTSDKSSNADKSFKQVANGLHAVPAKSPPAPAARTAKTDVEIPALKARSLREKTQDEEQEQIEADTAAVLDSTAMAWAPTAQSSDVILAQAGAADGARIASDAAGANSGMKNIDWGVASNPSPAASGLASMWSGAALLGGLLVAGLGGGGGGKSDIKVPAETALKLTVQDGLIAGAKVYRDVKDDQHLVGTTDANGQLVLSKALTGSGVLIAVGGTNIDTGLVNTLDLKISFSAGVSASTVMTPVTTLVTALLDSGVASIAAAETAVKQLLDLSMQLNLSTYDPMDAANAGSADALALRKAGAQIVQLATQLPNADQFFIALAKEVKTADSWGAMVQDEGFVSTLLADQLSQLSDEQRAELTASIVQDLTALGAVKTAGSLSAVQLNAAQLTVDLYQDTGTDRATQTDHITINAQLAIRGYNTGAGYDSIEISLDLGNTWKTFDQAQFIPNSSVQDITVMVRQAGLTATQSDPLTFTWVSQAAQAPQLSLTDDTGTSGSDGITSNSQITLGQVSNLAIVVGNQTFQAQLEYSLNGDDFLPIPEGGLFNGLQGVLPDGHYDLQVRAYYPGLALESNPARLSFTLDTEAMVPQGYAITAVEGSFQDPDSTDRVFSAQGASSVLFTLNQAPEAGATVTSTIGKHSFDVFPDANGIWQASIPVEDLQPGTQTLSIHIVDAAGNTASADMPAFIFDNEAYAYVVGQDADGFDIVAAPDQIATLVLESDSFLQDNVTNVTLPVLEGTAEADTVITLSIDGNTIGTGRANEAGAWRIAATAVLEEGEYIPVVTVTDVAGNVSDEFEGAAFTIVTTKPESSDVMLKDVDPSSDEELVALIEEVGLDISALTAPYTDSAAVSAAGITFELTSLDTGSDNADGITMFPLPRINGTVSGSGDLLVFVSLRDISTDVEPTELVKFAPITAVDGEWSVQVTQPLGAEGESHIYVPYITVMDGAGNIIRTSGAPIVIDRQAPEEATAELVHDEDNDTGIDATDGLTANLQPMLQGTAEAGATVVVDVMADGTLVYTATVESDGTWTVRVEDDLPEGEWTPQITVIDLAGNVSAPIDAEVLFTVDATPPDAPAFNAFGDTEGNDTGALTDDFVTSNNAPTLSGTAEEGSFVTVTVGDWVSEPIEAVGGEWSITVDELADGEYTPEVVAVDAAGNASEAVTGETFTVLTTAPDAGDLTVGLKHDSASDTGLDAEDNITNSAELQIEGTAPEGMRVVVELDGTVYGLDEEIIADADGNWSVTITDLPEGEYTPVARLVDVVGNESENVEGTPFTVDLTPPEYVTANLTHDEANDTGTDAEDNITNNVAPMISGTVEAGALVTVTVGDWMTDEPVQVGEDGTWSVTVGVDLEDGEYAPVVTVADVAGNLLEEFEGETFTVKTTIEAPAMNAFGDTEGNDTGALTDDFVTSNNAPTLSGTAEEGSFVTVTVGDWVSEPIEAVGGEWSITVDELADGEYTPEVVAVDAAGNASEAVTGETFTVLTTAPDAGDLTVGLKHDSASDTGLDAEDNITNSAELQIEGTAPEGMRVVVELDGTVYGLDEEIIADADGNWSVTITDLPEGEYTPVARLVDVVGNESENVEGTPFTVDLTPPEYVTANLTHDEANDTGTDAEDNITNNVAPMISGTVEAGALVTVTVGDWMTDEPVQVGEDGTWSVTVGVDLEDGEYAPVVTVADVAGNLLEEFEGETFTVKTTIEAPAMNAFGDTEGNDTGALTDDFVTSNNAPTLSGTAEEGSFVTVTVGDWVSEPIEAVGGEWSITVDELADGEYTPEVVAVDAAGNASEAVTGETFTVLTTAPDAGDLTVGLKHDSASDTGLDAEDNITNSAELQIEGTAPEGMRVVVELDGTVYGLDEEIIADADGNWSVTITDLPEGEYTPVARLVDVVGNESENVEGTPFTVDLTPPEYVTANLTHDEANDTGTDAEDNITNNVAPMISGTVEAGALVTVTVGDWMTDEPVQVGEDGTWSVTVGVDLEDGEYAPVVTVADVAGNLLEEFEGETFTVKTTIEAPAMNAFGDTEGNDTGALTDDFVTSNNAPTLSGTAEEGSFVTVTVGDWVSEPIEAVGGEWSITVDELADGEYTPEVVAVDAAGNASEAVTGETFTVLTTAPDAGDLTVGLKHDSASDTGLDAEDNITNSAELQIEGTAPEGMRVVVELDGTVYGLDEEIIADADGNWSVTITDLPEGEYTPVARLVDVVGNESENVEGTPFTVDLTPPEYVTANLTHDEANDTGTDAEDNITNNVAPMISGTVEAGALVTVTVGDWMTDEPVQVGEDGTWSVTVGVDLEDGEYAPVVTVADVAGNLLEEFEGETFTVKTTIEAPAMNAFGDTEGNDTGALTDDFVTSNNAPTLSGTAEEGSFVTVTVGDWVSEPIEAVGGEWSITVDELADGEYTPEVVAVDAAGNASEAVTGETFTVDTEMSEEPTLAEFSDIDGNETGVSLTDRITNNVAPVFEGQAEALAWVTLVIQQQYDNSDWTVVQEMDPIQADDTGYWTASLNEDLLDGTYRAVVKAADMAGNESAEVQGPSFTVDTLAPVLPQQLTPHIVSINTSMNYQPTAGAGVHVVSMEDATGTLPEGLTINDTSYQLTGLTEVAGFTWLSAIMADEAGNESALPVYQSLIFVSDIRPTTQTINHISAAAAKLYQGTNGDNVGFSLFKAPGDVLLTKEGDDLVTVSSADGLGFAYVDGGAGVDTMKFTVADIAMDFSQFNNSGTGQLLKDFEIFQFTGRDASVSISAQDIFGLSSQVFGANFVYNLRIDGASGNQSASLTDLEARTKIVTDRDGYEEEVNETFDATGSQSNSGKYHKYSGFFTDELEVDRLVTLLIDKSFVV